MNFGHLLFSAKGRIGRGRFWAGVGIVVVAYVVGGFVAAAAGSLMTLLSFLLLILVVWMAVAVHSKRMHDFGRSGWWFGGALFVSLILMVMAIWPAVSEAVQLTQTDPEIANDQEAMAELLMENVSLGRLYSALLPPLAILLWAGLMPGSPMPNRFGPALD